MKSSCHNSFKLYSHGISAGSHTQQLQTITYRCREKHRFLHPSSYKHNMKSSCEFIQYRDTEKHNIMDFILMSAWQEKYFLSYFKCTGLRKAVKTKRLFICKNRGLCCLKAIAKLTSLFFIEKGIYNPIYADNSSVSYECCLACVEPEQYNNISKENSCPNNRTEMKNTSLDRLEGMRQ